jgi:hypothetical protein
VPGPQAPAVGNGVTVIGDILTSMIVLKVQVPLGIWSLAMPPTGNEQVPEPTQEPLADTSISIGQPLELIIVNDWAFEVNWKPTNAISKTNVFFIAYYFFVKYEIIATKAFFQNKFTNGRFCLRTVENVKDGAGKVKINYLGIAVSVKKVSG